MTVPSIVCHNATPWFAKSLATDTTEENKLRKSCNTKIRKKTLLSEMANENLTSEIIQDK